MSEEEIRNWSNYGRGWKGEPWMLFARNVKTICSVTREALMSEGKLNPAVGIFWQKNYDGLRDDRNLVVEAGETMRPTMSPEQLRQKYIDSLPEAD